MNNPCHVVENVTKCVYTHHETAIWPTVYFWCGIAMTCVVVAGLLYLRHLDQKAADETHES